MDTILPGVLAAGAFIVVFPLFWMGVVWLVSRMSGWAALASQYPAKAQPTGDLFHMRSGRLRFFSNYSHCLTVAVSSDGIYLKPLFFFRAGHDPVFLPWSAIEAARSSGKSFFSSAHFLVRDKAGGSPRTVTLYGQALVESLKKHYQRLQQQQRHQKKLLL